ncbi:MAG: alpha/beta hydrolase [Gemmatimonadota bacterium]|nr:alpha/beta hydrolase [Gemmatimonadota bacterium]
MHIPSWTLGALALSVMAAPAWGGTITLKAKDGRTLKADSRGSGDKCVVLIHGKERTSADFEWLTGRLADNGFRVVALDLRGHGASGGSLEDATWDAMPHDVHAATKYLARQGAEEIILIGSEFGASLALYAAAEDERVTSLVLLSPEIVKLKETPMGDAMDAYGERSVLIIADDSIKMDNRTAAFLHDRAQGPKHLEWSTGAGEGIKMLNRKAGLEGLILSWLNGTYEVLNRDLTDTRELDASETDDIETSGKKFGEER